MSNLRKSFKKLGALFMSLCMVMAMGVTAFASDYVITIENSIGGSTYSAYKIFDAQYNGDAVSYSIDSNSAWFDTISAANDIFILTQYAESNDIITYQVGIKTDVEDEAVSAFFKGILDGDNVTYIGTVAATGEGNGLTLTLDVNEPGYYYVTSNVGSVVSLTTAAPTALIIDKNQKPGEGKPQNGDPEDPNWEGGFTKDAGDTNYSVGDSVSYSIRSYVPTYNGELKIASYTITDTIGAGLTLNSGSVKIEIAGTNLEGYVDITDKASVSTESNNDGTTTMTVTFDPRQITDYPADAMVRITYTCTVNEAADDVDLTNTAKLSWKEYNPSDYPDGDPNPDDPGLTPEDDEETPTVQVYTYGFDLRKADGTDENAKILEGAQFTLQKYGSDELIQFLYDETSDTYEEYDGVADGTPTTTITVADGEINIWGLGSGTYILTETVAPDGYNILEAPITIVITETESGWTVSVDGSDEAYGVIASGDSHGVSTMPTVTIVNQAGASLPGTGGIGTTLFYVIGGALIIGAAVTLIVRRRMRNEA